MPWYWCLFVLCDVVFTLGGLAKGIERKRNNKLRTNNFNDKKKNPLKQKRGGRDFVQAIAFVDG